jgi:hypothetical protein
MSDLGHMTNGILDNALDLVEIWKTSPWRRDEFGRRELDDIEQAKKQLAGLEQYILIHMNRKLKVASNG